MRRKDTELDGNTTAYNTVSCLIRILQDETAVLVIIFHQIGRYHMILLEILQFD